MAAIKDPINLKKYKNVDLINITGKSNINKELSQRFIDDVIRITGLEIDEEGYIVDAESDPIEPEYILIKGKVLRHTNQGILHNKDMIFDPYNNPVIMEELFRKYLMDSHPNVSISQIYAAKENEKSKMNCYGYITIIFDNGAKIKTGCHWKDTTKYLEAFMRLESMTDAMINDVIAPYDAYEQEYFTNPDNFL